MEKITNTKTREELAKIIEEKPPSFGIDTEMLDSCVKDIRSGRAVVYRLDNRGRFKVTFKHRGQLYVIESAHAVN